MERETEKTGRVRIKWTSRGKVWGKSWSEKNDGSRQKRREKGANKKMKARKDENRDDRSELDRWRGGKISEYVCAHPYIIYMCCPQAFRTNNWEVRLAAMVTTNPITLANKHSHVHLTPSLVGSVMLKVCQCLEMHASYKTLQKRWDAFKNVCLFWISRCFQVNMWKGLPHLRSLWCFFFFFFSFFFVVVKLQSIGGWLCR